MSKIAIAYYSRHHGNTKKLLDAIKESDPSVVLIDVTEKHEVDLTRFDIIGFASGIYFGVFSENVVTFAKINLPPQKKVFFVATAGNPTSAPALIPSAPLSLSEALKRDIRQKMKSRQPSPSTRAR